MSLDHWSFAICMGQKALTSGNFLLLRGLGNLEPQISDCGQMGCRGGQEGAAESWAGTAPAYMRGWGCCSKPPPASSWALILSQVGFLEGAAAFHIHLGGGSKALEAGNHWLRQPAFGFIYFLCWVSVFHVIVFRSNFYYFFTCTTIRLNLFFL